MPPDISQMTPEERAERLYDRVMALNERGRDDSVRVLRADGDAGLLRCSARSTPTSATTSGASPQSRATQETAQGAGRHHSRDSATASARTAPRCRRRAASRRSELHETRYLRRFVAAEPAERAKQLPEYQQHDNEIDAGSPKFARAERLANPNEQRS